VFLTCLDLVFYVFALVHQLLVPLIEFVNHKCHLGNAEHGVQSDGLQLWCLLVETHRKLLNGVKIVFG